jgi:hypothetical protein
MFEITIGNIITIFGISVSIITSIVGVTYWIVSKLSDIDKRTTVTQIEVSDLKSSYNTMSQMVGRLEDKVDKLSMGEV